MEKIADLIDEIIKLGIADFLKIHGFKKTGRTWHLIKDDNWLIVNLQASTTNMGGEGKFTINVGVYVPAIVALDGQLPANGKPKEYDSTIRKRLGSLFSGQDYWWEVDSTSDLFLISSDVVEKLNCYGLPWLQTHSNIAAISEALKDNPSLVSICAALLADGKEEASKRIQRAITERPSAKTRLHSWALENNISL